MAETLSDFGLKLNYWYLTNRQQLRKWWVLVFLALDIFLLAAVLVNGLLLTFRFRDVTNVVGHIAAQTQDIGSVQGQVAPTPLNVGSVVVTPHGLGRYDFSVRIENLNPTWSVTIVDQFAGGSKTLSPVRVVIPPKSVRYAMALDVESATGSAPAATVSTTTVTWTRLPADQAKPLDVSVQNLVVATKTLVTGNQVVRTVTQASGDLVNKTFSTIHSLRIAIILTQNGKTVGVRSAILSTVGPEQTVPFSVEWDAIIPDVQAVEAYPEISRDSLSA